MVLKKSKKDNSVLFVDASEQFVRRGNKNKLTEDNQESIVNSFTERVNVDYFAKLVANEEIANNDYNIAVSSYVEKENTRQFVDITELNAEIERIVARQAQLRTAIDAIVSDLEASK